jgi:hypothetical protein
MGPTALVTPGIRDSAFSGDGSLVHARRAVAMAVVPDPEVLATAQAFFEPLFAQHGHSVAEFFQETEDFTREVVRLVGC